MEKKLFIKLIGVFFFLFIGTIAFAQNVEFDKANFSDKSALKDGFKIHHNSFSSSRYLNS